MKKLSRKLVLSSLSLGLAVATLSTTTYAWYTNNTSVAADDIQGTTEAGSSVGLLISDAYDGTYSNSVTLTSAKYTVDGSKMVPLQYKSGVGLTDMAGAASVDATNKGYLQFSLFVKATSDTTFGSGVPVYLESLTVANAGEALTEYDIIKSYDGGWAADATKYSVDAAQALNFTYVAKKLAAKGNNSTDIGTTAYSVNSIVTPLTQTGLPSDKSKVDALTYYNTVMAPTTALTRDGVSVTEVSRITASTSTTESQAIEIAKIADASVYEVVFTVWLDGWDKYCFDACKGQTFKITLSLTSELGKVTITK